MQAIGQGVAAQFLPDYTSFINICNNFEISTETCSFLWNDVNYGLFDPNNYEVWVDFSFYQNKDS
jgi:hypothetical protein